MEYRTLGGTGLKISRVGFGAMTFGAQVDNGTAHRMIDRCLDLGVNFLDTANAYNAGRSESILGQTLASRRKDVILATKVGMRLDGLPDESGLSRTAVQKAVESSLKRLGTDYLDFCYLHQPDHNTPIEDTLAAMDELVRAGKIRYPAVSNYAAWEVVEIHCISKRKNYKPPYVSQVMYNLIARGIEDEYLPFSQRFGVATIAYNPLAGGLLTGKHRPEGPPKPGTRFEKSQIYLNRYWHADYFAAVEELGKIARDAGKSLVELALQWLLSRDVDVVLLGASRMEQLEENLNACGEAQLTAEVLKRCDDVWHHLRGASPQYIL